MININHIGKKDTVFKPLWEFIPVGQYREPSAPTRENVRKSISFFWKQLHPATFSGRFDHRKSVSVPSFLLNRAAPPPDLKQVVTALGLALKGWFTNTESHETLKVVIGAPGSYVDEVVKKLAQQNDWRVMGIPSTQEILSGGDKWLERATQNEMAPLVIPHLGECYLRHQDGLLLISRLLDWLQTTRRRCLLVCDSWAWAYLSKVLQIDAVLPPPLSLAPLDGARLQFWLPTLSSRDNGCFEFRDALNGRSLFSTIDNYAEQIRQNARPGQMEWYGDWIGVSHYFRQLAAYSRGLPQVVWHLWRHSLQMLSDEHDQISSKSKKQSNRYTIWVQPWAKLELPIVPNWAGTNEAMVLHTLLLHSGATSNLVDFLLPLSHEQVRCVLHNLLFQGLVEVDKNAMWNIPLLAYPVVRQFMKDEGFMVDGF